MNPASAMVKAKSKMTEMNMNGALCREVHGRQTEKGQHIKGASVSWPFYMLRCAK
jgi:hypothetical protein